MHCRREVILLTKINAEFPDEFTNSIKNAIIQVIDEASKSALSDQYPTYMTKSQAAQYLNIALNTLDQWIATTNIPYVKFGKIYRFNRNELDKFMTSTK
ncbi:helix-turn-helix domain-containing protein [Lactobacillus sp. M31]|uniref:Helix-turn-helix domain-containing protein n=1 Tax=Limosilactobacillus walteri TaxID=2268022 RepID=A0ABR8P8G2_9LACO|nr:helix-turn-helix domain-containing protein [Limosilactobacillus walteri]